MGISGLLPLLKKASKNCNIRKFSGCTVAIDAYCWLHKGAFGCAEKLGKGEPTTACIIYCMKYINVLLDNKIKPILVLDGRNLPSKEHTEKKRREKRDENRKQTRKYLQEGNRKGAWECFTRCVDITPAMAREFIKELRRLNIDYVVAPYEADAQLAYLARNGIADIIITEDSDLVLFGCPRIFFKMNVNGDGVYFDQSKIPQSLGVKPNQYTFERFRWMCILSGCDYLPSIPGIGLERAKKLIFSTTEQDVKKIIISIPNVVDKVDKVTDEYIRGFLQAENTFLYQLVFDTVTRKVVPLTPYPVSVDPEELKYAGRYEDRKMAIGLALGNVDLHSLNTVDSFDPLKSGYSSSSIWSPSFNPGDRATVIEKDVVSHSTTVGMQFSVSLGSSLMKKRPLADGSNDENGVEDNDLLNLYSEEKAAKTEFKSDSDADDDFKRSSPPSIKRRRLSKEKTDNQASGSPSVNTSTNTRSKARTPFLKSPENPVTKTKILVRSKYFRTNEEEENVSNKKEGLAKINVTETETQKFNISEKEKIASAHVLLQKLPIACSVTNLTSSQLSIYSLESNSSGSTLGESQYSSHSRESHTSKESNDHSESSIIFNNKKRASSAVPEIALDDVNDDEAYESCSASTTKSTVSNSSSSYSQQRTSYSCSPGMLASSNVKTSSTFKAVAPTRSTCRRQGLARSTKAADPRQRSVRDMLFNRQSN